ncbi:hypothetical protein J3A83DRAFT_4186284 [Scleroderma citrinum]
MASKQLGKLKQWAGEKISTRDKSVVADEFRELEQDIELRKQGMLRLQAATQAYHHVLSKKKVSPVSGETEKLMAIDALGIVMVSHGEEFGEDSTFGTSLTTLGRAHCKIATLQEAYALTLRDTFLTSCERFLQDIKDYEHQRKKLDTRRSSYDTAISKLDKIKSSKKEKEKERREAEDELQRSRLQFEETSDNVRSRMHNIQENETRQLRELTMFLDVQLNFAKQYVEVLQDVKENWHDSSTPASNDSDEDDIAERTGPIARRKSCSDSRSTSRPDSRASRGRSDSSVTASGLSETNNTTPKSNKRISVTGWASSAVSSIAGRGKKDRDNFTALTNEDDEDNADQDHRGQLSRQTSSKSLSLSRKSPKGKGNDLPSGSDYSPKIPVKILKPPSQRRKHVKALHNFTGSSDELSFRAGEEITVINEVLEDWWLGMLQDGRRGLFPVNYTTIITNPPGTRPFTFVHEDSHWNEAVAEDDESSTYHMSSQPMDIPHSATSFGFDVRSITSTVTEDDESQHLVPARRPSTSSDEVAFEVPSRTRDSPPLPRSRTSPDISSVVVGRKAPPPPPPRRTQTSSLPPLIPDRPPPGLSKGRLLSQTDSASSASSSSSYTSPVYLTPTTSSSTGNGNGTGANVSPFDSLTDVSAGCTGFRQLANERKGMCANCFRVH